MNNNTIRMYRNVNSGALGIATYIDKMNSENLGRIVMSDNFFHKSSDFNTMGIYLSPYHKVEVHDDMWVVKYGHGAYGVFLNTDFQDLFEEVPPVLENIQEYIEKYMIINVHAYKELVDDLMKLS